MANAALFWIIIKNGHAHGDLPIRRPLTNFFYAQGNNCREGRKLPQPGVSLGRQLPAVPGRRQLPQLGVPVQQRQQTAPGEYRVKYICETLHLLVTP